MKIKLTKKQKKIYIIASVIFAVLCLLVELLGHIPGIPFNGWVDIFNATGSPQYYVTPEGKLEVHFIDVGNADSILIRQGEFNLLIDAGDSTDEKEMLDYLSRHKVEAIDLLIATHPHDDHIGSMETIVNRLVVERCVMSFMPEGKEPTTSSYLRMLEALEEHDVPIEEAKAGAVYEIGTAQLEILAPLKEDSEANNISVVTRLTFGEHAFLFMGDAESEVERQILTQGYAVESDVIKVGHHGSKTSTSDVFLKTVNPTYAMITCGAENKHGHPHQVTIDTLAANEVSVFRSDQHGDVVFTSDGTELQVRTQKEAA